MRIRKNFLKYQNALRFKNKIMFKFKSSNPRIYRKPNSKMWGVSYTLKKGRLI